MEKKPGDFAKHALDMGIKSCAVLTLIGLAALFIMIFLIIL